MNITRVFGYNMVPGMLLLKLSYCQTLGTHITKHFLLPETHQKQRSVSTKDGQKSEDPSEDGRVQDPTDALLPLPGLVAVPATQQVSLARGSHKKH